MSRVATIAPNYVEVQIFTAEHRHHPIAGLMWSASERFLRMLLRMPIEPGEYIELSIHGCRVAGEVVFCQLCPEGYNTGIQLLDRDLVRSEPRFPLDLPAVLTVIGTTGPREIAVQLADVSASGVGLFSPVQLADGACVEIRLDLGLIFGEVRYCRPYGDGRYRVGIAIYHMLARDQHDKSARPAPPLFGWLRRNPI